MSCRSCDAAVILAEERERPIDERDWDSIALASVLMGEPCTCPYDGPTDLVIRSSGQIIRLSISNRDEIMGRADFTDGWRHLSCLTLKSSHGYYVHSSSGTPMLDVTPFWVTMQLEKYPNG